MSSSARIKLIVTGDMEKGAICDFLKRFFPGMRNDQKVIWDSSKIGGVTTHRLEPAKKLYDPMKRLVKAMIAEAMIGKTGRPADLVVVLDDVELNNLGQESVVAQVLKNAVEDELVQRNSATRTVLRDKCSFYLFKPMVEAYLFGDANALEIACVQAPHNPRLVHPTDVEQFETNDPAYLIHCKQENNTKKQKDNAPWWREECHAKHYLEHLTKGSYKETDHGKEALKEINWKNVPKCHSDMPIIRSLFQDISDWFGIPNPLGAGSFDPIFYPANPVNRSNLLLRNL
ncbi:MAG: hypothetical protein HQL93_05835 [Magnetococcales bacterium]|nr:hypothetical protein [Magnetococcales bacterium]